ncbi:hypothetical protein [Streptomyces sp.]|uniref:hypothetical protein n=1 Tax=Streptomyces sp. TaxID=1931 RepID=UPI002D4E56EE|nr:hypothetical protein [Streptomyces sp.]HZF90891.1 hypothetical protein [Streptomyces sp.]
MARKALTGALASAVLLLSAVSPLSPVSPFSSVPAVASDADGRTAAELAEQAEDNLLDADSVRMTMTDRIAEAEGAATEPSAMDLALDRDGNCVGTIETGGEGDGRVEIVKRGEEVWMKPDAAFWKAQVPGGEGEAVAELLKGRYLHGTTDDPALQGMADVCDLAAFQRDIDTGGSGDAALTKGEETNRQDTAVVPLTSEEGGERTTLYVTADAPHRLIEADQRGDDTDLTLTFEDYDKPVPAGTPRPAETVDIGKLEEELLDV